MVPQAGYGADPVECGPGHMPVWLELQTDTVAARDVVQGHVLVAERGRIGQPQVPSGGNTVPCTRL